MRDHRETRGYEADGGEHSTGPSGRTDSSGTTDEPESIEWASDGPRLRLSDGREVRPVLERVYAETGNLGLDTAASGPGRASYCMPGYETPFVELSFETTGVRDRGGDPVGFVVADADGRYVSVRDAVDAIKRAAGGVDAREAALDLVEASEEDPRAGEHREAVRAIEDEWRGLTADVAGAAAAGGAGMAGERFDALAEVLLEADPWPEGSRYGELAEMADEEARRRGHGSWVEAVHARSGAEPADGGGSG